MQLTAEPPQETPAIVDPADQYINKIKHLPPAPTIATELLDLFKNENHDVDRIVELINHDPALTMEVLKRCNSAFFGGRTPVSDMFQAVTRVGFYEIYCAVVSMLASRTLALAEAAGNSDTGALWRHAVITAVSAGTLASFDGDGEAAAFTTGLLHDVGKLILMSAEPEIYAQIANETGICGPVFLEMERSLLGVTHAAVGARLLARWGLPGHIATAVLHHHGPACQAGPAERITAIVIVADLLAHQIAPYSPAQPVANPESMKLLGLTPEQLPDVARQMDNRLKRVAGLLGLVSA